MGGLRLDVDAGGVLLDGVFDTGVDLGAGRGEVVAGIWGHVPACGSSEGWAWGQVREGGWRQRRGERGQAGRGGTEELRSISEIPQKLWRGLGLAHSAGQSTKKSSGMMEQIASTAVGRSQPARMIGVPVTVLVALDLQAISHTYPWDRGAAGAAVLTWTRPGSCSRPA